MKKIIFILLIIILSGVIYAEEMSFGIFLPIKLDINNISIKNGPAPYLHKEFIEEKIVPENNFIEELEIELIEIKTLEKCA